MKRLMILMVLTLAAFIAVSCSATYTEQWRGPAGKATPVCQPQAGLGFAVGDEEFIPVGYYTWTDVHRNTHKELVYVKRPAKGGAK